MPRPNEKPAEKMVEKTPEKAVEKPIDKPAEKAVQPKSEKPLVLYSVIIDGRDYTVYAADAQDLKEKIEALRAAIKA